MIRKFLVFSMTLSLAMTTFACTSASLESSSPSSPVANSTSIEQPAASPTRISDGTYPVQQATYDDGSGEYNLMLLNTLPGESSTYRGTNLPMARLTEEEVTAGQKSYLKVEGGQPSFHLTEDFRIEYVHNVAETQTNPQTGQQETVIVRRESNFWSPFAGALAGQALGSLLFTPQYYMPPVYRPGTVLTGYGGYGNSYDQAVNSYRTKHNAPPAEVKNRQTFRTTGQIRRSPAATTASPNASPRKSPQVNQGNRATGSGYGSTDLQRSNNSKPKAGKSGGSFGSGRSSGARRRTGGGRRR